MVMYLRQLGRKGLKRAILKLHPATRTRIQRLLGLQESGLNLKTVADQNLKTLFILRLAKNIEFITKRCSYKVLNNVFNVFSPFILFPISFHLNFLYIMST